MGAGRFGVSLNNRTTCHNLVIKSQVIRKCGKKKSKSSLSPVSLDLTSWTYPLLTVYLFFLPFFYVQI